MSSSMPQRLRAAWREARENNRRPEPATQPRFDARSWSGALVLMACFTGLLWIVQVIDAADDHGLDRFGMRPRAVDGLWGIGTQPFLDVSYQHLLSNTVPVLLVGWVLLLSGIRGWLTVTAIVIVLGGLATWLVAPSGLILGASSMVFGWLGYLLARAYFARRVRWIVTAVAVLLFFGTLLSNLLPSYHSTLSWQSHLCGFGAGVVAGAVLHPRRRRDSTGRRGRRGRPGTRTADDAPVS